MVKLTSSILVAVLLPALAIASANQWDIETRAVSENDLFGRELSEAESIVFARDMQELFARLPEGFSQDETQELVRRFHSPGWGNFFKGIKYVAKKAASLFTREDGSEVFVREDAELDAREPDHIELSERDLEEDLYLREFGGWEVDELD